MKARGLGWVAAVAIGAATLAAAAAQAQSIADRVARVSDGTVRMSFALLPGICGNGRSVWRNNRSGHTTWGDNMWRVSDDVVWDDDCNQGPGRVVVVRRRGEISDLRFYVGGRWRPAGADVTDLGTVAAPDAAAYLLSVAQTERGSMGEKAIFPATLVDSTDVWPSLIRIARNQNLPRSTRTQAVFWVGQAAGEAATRGLSDIAIDNAVDREVREQAVFALSQRPRDQGVPALIAIARSNKDPEIRKKAMFWLGQSGDPRALDLFEEILTKK